MRITIYQIIPELDQDRLMFLPLSCFQKAGYQTPPAGIYESVFCGETEAATLEEIYQIFNRTDEADTRYLEKIGFTGHSLSVSDILEVQDAPGDSRFYFCDTFGFPQISFQKEHAMLPVQNHNYIPYEQIIRSKSGPNPVIWHIWMTADFLFIPVSRSSFSAANTASASLDTVSVICITTVGSSGNFWSVLRFFSLEIRMDCHRKVYGTKLRHLRYGFPDTRHTARKI